MNDQSLDAFLGKWRARWPEWAVAEVFLPVAQRQRAVAWYALLQEFEDAMNPAGDATPTDAKLAWWSEELAGWSRGVRRHPLGIALQRAPVPWAVLAAALPVSRAAREAAGPAGENAYAQALAAIEAELFAGDGGRIVRMHAALVQARERRAVAGKPPVLPALSALLAAWRAARG